MEVRSLPHYQGSDVYGFYPVPFLDVRPGPGTPPPALFTLRATASGLRSSTPTPSRPGRVAPGSSSGPSTVKHNPSLAGLGNVGATAEVGGLF